MTPDQLDALPRHAIVLDTDRNTAWTKRGSGVWSAPTCFDVTDEDLADKGELRVIHPAPEPDHSMCARLEPSNGVYPWALKAPDGQAVGYLADDQARARRFAIPEPDPTVRDKVRAVLTENGVTDDVAAELLAELVPFLKDDEQ